MYFQVLNGTPLSKIAVCGFSQGGALAMHVALRYENKKEAKNGDSAGASSASCDDGADTEQLAGCVVLSGWYAFDALIHLEFP